MTEMTEESELLGQTARALFDRAGGVRRAREARDTAERWSRDVWAQMTELGWPAITVPAAHGGAGLSVADTLPVFEAMGRALAPEPYLSAVLGGELIRLAGTPEQHELWLPRIAAGAVVAVAGAHQGRSSHPAPSTVELRAEADCVQLDGRFTHVADGMLAEAVIVLAAAGAALVPLNEQGARLHRQHLIDSRDWAIVELDRVRLPRTALLPAGPGLPSGPVDVALDAATLALCAEMLGLIWECFDRTLAYVKERVQFGRRIGSFQAVQHRLGRLYSEVLVADAIVRGAGSALGSGDPAVPALVSAAKVRCGSAARLVAKESVQLHGGIGVTDECDIGLFVKRLRVTEFLLGDETWHLDRWASCRGY